MFNKTSGATHAVATVLNRLKAVPSASRAYDALSDSFIWSDELPDNVKLNPERYRCLQAVFRYRMSLVLASPDKDLESVWNQAKELFPQWPGFTQDRCKPNADLQSDYQVEHKAAIEAFNAIPD